MHSVSDWALAICVLQQDSTLLLYIVICSAAIVLLERIQPGTNNISSLFVETTSIYVNSMSFPKRVKLKIWDSFISALVFSFLLNSWFLIFDLVNILAHYSSPLIGKNTKEYLFIASAWRRETWLHINGNLIINNGLYAITGVCAVFAVLLFHGD